MKVELNEVQRIEDTNTYKIVYNIEGSGIEEINKVRKAFNHIGDYEIRLSKNNVLIECYLEVGELHKQENLEGRLFLIKKDIENIIKNI